MAHSSHSRRRPLCLTFDAFGTLFHPRQPIATQYATVARKYSLSGFTDEEIGRSFKDAFKNESKKHPNYGKTVGMVAEQWWANVIRETFRPFLPASKPFPHEAILELLTRFSSSEGYKLYPDVLPFFRRLRRDKQHSGTIVGIITNSDARVPSILTSLGLSVGPLRCNGTQWDEVYDAGHVEGSDPEAEDIDFVTLSYDVGFEKPDRRIFDAVKRLMQQIKDKDRDFLHVGDDSEKDVKGAKAAGWESVLLDRDTEYAVRNDDRIRDLADLTKLLEL